METGDNEDTIPNRTRYSRSLASGPFVLLAAACAIVPLIAAPDSAHTAAAPDTIAGLSSPLRGSAPSLVESSTAPVVQGPLSLDLALRLALSNSPALTERVWTARAEIDRARDEARFLNPTVDLTDENFGGSLGSGHDERTIAIAQPLRFGGLRGAQRSVVSSLDRLGRLDLEVARREVAIETGNAFVDAWLLENRLIRLKRSEAIAATAIEAARERTRIGAAPVVESLRARAQHAAQGIERRHAEADLEIARLRLASLWGAREATFDTLVLSPPANEPLPNADSMLAGIENRPEVRRAHAQTQVAAARLRVARADRFPELTPSGGVRQFAETNQTGFLVGLSVGLPVWNRGQYRVAAAEAEHRVAVARERTIRVALQQELMGSYRRMIAARDDYRTASDEALPAAQEALARLGAGYRAGRFTYLDYVEGQRAALDVDLSMLDAVREYWSARLAIEWGVGTAPPSSTGP